MGDSSSWAIAAQVWLAASVIGPNGWQSASCVLLGCVWFCGALLMEARERKRRQPQHGESKQEKS